MLVPVQLDVISQSGDDAIVELARKHGDLSTMTCGFLSCALAQVVRDTDWPAAMSRAELLARLERIVALDADVLVRCDAIMGSVVAQRGADVAAEPAYFCTDDRAAGWMRGPMGMWEVSEVLRAGGYPAAFARSVWTSFATVAEMEEQFGAPLAPKELAFCREEEREMRGREACVEFAETLLSADEYAVLDPHTAVRPHALVVDLQGHFALAVRVDIVDDAADGPGLSPTRASTLPPLRASLLAAVATSVGRLVPGHSYLLVLNTLPAGRYARPRGMPIPGVLSDAPAHLRDAGADDGSPIVAGSAWDRSVAEEAASKPALRQLLAWG